MVNKKIVFDLRGNLLLKSFLLLFFLILFFPTFSFSLGVSPAQIEFPKATINGFTSTNVLLSSTNGEGFVKIVSLNEKKKEDNLFNKIIPLKDYYYLRLNLSFNNEAPGYKKGFFLFSFTKDKELLNNNALIEESLLVPYKVFLEGNGLKDCVISSLTDANGALNEKGLISFLIKNTGSLSFYPKYNIIIFNNESSLIFSKKSDLLKPTLMRREKILFNNNLSEGNYSLIIDSDCGSIRGDFKVLSLFNPPEIKNVSFKKNNLLLINASILNNNDFPVEIYLKAEIYENNKLLSLSSSNKVLFYPYEKKNLELYIKPPNNDFKVIVYAINKKGKSNVFEKSFFNKNAFSFLKKKSLINNYSFKKELINNSYNDYSFSFLFYQNNIDFIKFFFLLLIIFLLFLIIKKKRTFF